MNYDSLIYEAINKDEMTDLLCGIKPYEVEVPEFTSDVFPTDVNAVLVNCIYKKKTDIENIDHLFVESLEKMMGDEVYKLYTAILYFDACIFQEERKKATFEIEKEALAQKFKLAVINKRNELESTIVFDNGLSKDNAMKNIIGFSKYYQKKYGFSICHIP